MVVNKHFKRFVGTAIAIGIAGTIISGILGVVFLPLGFLAMVATGLAIAYVAFWNVAFMADEIAKTS